MHLTHYIGWPMSTGVNQSAENMIRRAKAVKAPPPKGTTASAD